MIKALEIDFGKEKSMRLTMKNHGNNTYRASLIRQDNNCLVGDVLNKLGRYEDICEDLQELER